MNGGALIPPAINGMVTNNIINISGSPGTYLSGMHTIVSALLSNSYVDSSGVLSA